MSVASAAILASALRPKESNPGGGGKETIGESIAKRPLQWLIVVGALGWVASKALKGVVKTGSETRTEGAETSSENNPFAFNNFLDWNKVPAGTKILSYQEALSRARQIYNALDVLAYENEDIVVGVFTSIPSKIQVAQVAKAFADNFGKDILTYIQQGNKTLNFWTGGLSAANYQRVIDNVARKPKY